MWVLRQKARMGGYLYFVKAGALGLPVTSADIREAAQFQSKEEAESAMSLSALTFEPVEV